MTHPGLTDSAKLDRVDRVPAGPATASNAYGKGTSPTRHETSSPHPNIGSGLTWVSLRLALCYIGNLAPELSKLSVTEL